MTVIFTQNYNPANVAITGGTLDGVQKVGFSQTAGGASDASLFWESTNVIAQRNGTNAQGFHSYNTFTNSSNYERAVFDWTSNANMLTIGTDNLGSGNSRGLMLKSAQNTTFRAAGVATGLYFTGTAFRPEALAGVTLGAVNFGFSQLFLDYTNTGTVGNVTINKAAGRVNMAAAGTTFTVTNSLVTANSLVLVTLASAPGNVVAVDVYAVSAAGSFTVNCVPAVTNQTAINFAVISTD